jgi:hypothetical protein
MEEEDTKKDLSFKETLTKYLKNSLPKTTLTMIFTMVTLSITCS